MDKILDDLMEDPTYDPINNIDHQIVVLKTVHHHLITYRYEMYFFSIKYLVDARRIQLRNSQKFLMLEIIRFEVSISLTWQSLVRRRTPFNPILLNGLIAYAFILKEQVECLEHSYINGLLHFDME